MNLAGVVNQLNLKFYFEKIYFIKCIPYYQNKVLNLIGKHLLLLFFLTVIVLKDFCFHFIFIFNVRKH